MNPSIIISNCLESHPHSRTTCIKQCSWFGKIHHKPLSRPSSLFPLPLPSSLFPPKRHHQIKEPSTNPFVATIASLTSLRSRALRRYPREPYDVKLTHPTTLNILLEGKMKYVRSLTLPPLRFEGQRKNLG